MSPDRTPEATTRDCGTKAVRRSVICLPVARTLLYKEVLRFWRVSVQTVAAPVLTAVLYLLISGTSSKDT